MDLEPWKQQQGEKDHEHAWLTMFCDMGNMRSVEAVANRCGVSYARVLAAAERHGWSPRAAAFDDAVARVTQNIMLSDDEALGAQYLAGRAMVHLAIKGLQTKNPSLLKMAQLQSMLKDGSEMMRRGAGIADIRVEHETQERVTKHLDGILGLIDGPAHDE